MSEPATAGDRAEDRSAGDSGPVSPGRDPRHPAPTSAERARAAGEALAWSGPRMGWGLSALGLLGGLGRGLERVAEGPSSMSAWVQAVGDGASWALALGLIGWAVALLCRLRSAGILEQIDRTRRGSDERMALAARAVEALERLVEVLARKGDLPGPWDSGAVDNPRAQSLAEIEHAIGSAQWAVAESLLETFEVRFPDDPSLPGLKGQLDAHRRRVTEGPLAELEAARQANDPERVLELYQAVGPALETPRRGALERDLARWFLNLIHRRLRMGRIQPEVVSLASRVAELFAATTDGASMRAALPTLRRSVGLCPRCAHPYAGTGAACPQCVARGPGHPAGTPLEPAPTAPPAGTRDDLAPDSRLRGESD